MSFTQLEQPSSRALGMLDANTQDKDAVATWQLLPLWK
jgi:hypothetical protein